jgi:hypothetical protein
METGDLTVELVFIAFLLLIGPLAVLYGADSRVKDTRDRRGWWSAR